MRTKMKEFKELAKFGELAQDLDNIGYHRGRKEREAEIIEMIKELRKVVKYKGGLIALEKQIKEQKEQ